VLDCPDFPIAGETRRGDADRGDHPDGISERTGSQMITGPSDRPRNESESHGALRTENYTARLRKMAEAVKLYQEIGFPALQKGGQDKKLVGYFQSDTGTINQLIHLWKFDDDADRRAHWAGLSANKDFVEGFASKFRPLLMTQEVKLLQAAPWGPHP